MGTFLYCGVEYQTLYYTCIKDFGNFSMRNKVPYITKVTVDEQIEITQGNPSCRLLDLQVAVAMAYVWKARHNWDLESHLYCQKMLMNLKTTIFKTLRNWTSKLLEFQFLLIHETTGRLQSSQKRETRVISAFLLKLGFLTFISNSQQKSFFYLACINILISLSASFATVKNVLFVRNTSLPKSLPGTGTQRGIASCVSQFLAGSGGIESTAPLLEDRKGGGGGDLRLDG